MTIFYKKIQEHNLTETETSALSLYMEKLRSVISAAKNIKDISGNMREIEESEDEPAHQVLIRLREFAFRTINDLNKSGEPENSVCISKRCFADMEQFYRDTIEFLYKNLDTGREREIPLSSVTITIRKTISAVEELVNSRAGI